METERLLVRPIRKADESAFAEGTTDRVFRTAYGFPAEMDAEVTGKIFDRFCGMPDSGAITEKATGNMIGFILNVNPEMPEKILAGLPGKGRTLAYAVFPPYQRRGYMKETLETYIRELFRNKDTDYIHCGHFTDNEASRSLLQQLGFHEYARHTAEERVIIDEILFR